MTFANKILSFEKYFTFKKNLIGNPDKCDEADPILSDFENKLEISLIPQKQCPGDCIHCPYSATTKKTIDRESYYPVNNMLKKITEHLVVNKSIKQVILTGYGETTLNSDLFHIINHIKTLTPAQIIIKTCGALFWRESVRHDCMRADVIHINIDAADKSVFKNIYRFLLQIPYERYINGITHFRQFFKGDFIVNTTLLDSINTEVSHLQKLSILIQSLDPVSITIRTGNGSGNAQKYSVEMNRLINFASSFGPIASVHSDDKFFPFLPGVA